MPEKGHHDTVPGEAGQKDSVGSAEVFGDRETERQRDRDTERLRDRGTEIKKCK